MDRKNRETEIIIVSASHAGARSFSYFFILHMFTFVYFARKKSFNKSKMRLNERVGQGRWSEEESCSCQTYLRSFLVIGSIVAPRWRR